MLLRYLVLDDAGQFRPVPRDTVELVWSGRRTTGALGIGLGEELRIVSVLYEEEDLSPRMCFFLRAELKGEEITDESRFEAYDAMSEYQRREPDSSQGFEQLDGWPEDWQRQLAVVLDVPVLELQQVGIGGPLLMADLWGYSIEQVLELIDQAW